MSHKTDAWMAFYPGDYLRDTMHLSRSDHGSYLLLILAYWSNKGPLPDDAEFLCAVAKVEQSEWQCVSKRLARFFQIGSGFWRHKRIDRELAAAQARREARSKAGKAGIEAKRKQKLSNASTEAIPEFEQKDTPSPSSSPSPEQSQRVGTCSQPIHTELPPGFPSTADEAKIAAHFVGCPEPFAISTWAKAMGRGGCDSKEVPIRSWRYYLQSEWTYEQDRRERLKVKTSSGCPRPLWAQIKDLEELIKHKKASLPGVSNPLLYPEQHKKDMEKRRPAVQELIELRKKLNELRDRQAKGEE